MFLSTSNRAENKNLGKLLVVSREEQEWWGARCSLLLSEGSTQKTPWCLNAQRHHAFGK